MQRDPHAHEGSDAHDATDADTTIPAALGGIALLWIALKATDDFINRHWDQLVAGAVVAAAALVLMAGVALGARPVKRTLRLRVWAWTLATRTRSGAVLIAGVAVSGVSLWSSYRHLSVTGIPRSFSWCESALVAGTVAGGSILALGAALWLLPRDADAMERGIFDHPEDEPHARRAILNRGITRAVKQAQSLPEDRSIFAVTVVDDARTWWRRIRAPRLHTPWRLNYSRNGGSAGGLWQRTRRTVRPTFPLEGHGAPPARMAVVGASGYGKSVLLQRFAHAPLAANEDVLVLDGKGDRHSLAEYASVSLRSHRPLTIDITGGLDIFAMGPAVAEAAIASLFADRVGNGEYYREWHVAAIRAACSGRPPRDMDDFLRRLVDPPRDLIPADQYALLKNRGASGHPTVSQGKETRNALEQHLRVLDRLRDPSWTFNSGGMVYVQTPLPDDEHYAKLIIEAFAAYRNQAHRQRQDRYTIILDEAAPLLTAANAPDISALLEQLRSQNMGLVLATQSYSGLGDQADRLLHAGTTLYIGNTSDPEPLLTVVGTLTAVESGQSRDSDQITKGDSARVQHQYKIPPDTIRTLPRGVFLASTPTPGDPTEGRVQAIVAVGPVRPPTSDEQAAIHARSVTTSTPVATDHLAYPDLDLPTAYSDFQDTDL